MDVCQNCIFETEQLGCVNVEKKTDDPQQCCRARNARRFVTL